MRAVRIPTEAAVVETKGASVRYHTTGAPRTDEFGAVAYADDVCVVPDVEPGGQAGDESA